MKPEGQNMRLIFFVAFTFITLGITAQGDRKISRKEYIDTYKNIAMEEMARSGIPASITLAQGLLESGDGNSRLAVKGNNHFGIKCHDNWDGKRIYHDDDENDECFRKYKSAEESYRDHTDFLTSRQRYAFLFKYPNDDYTAWAKGLKEAGYATSPTYSSALIKMIEENELFTFDREEIARNGGKTDNKKTGTSKDEIAGRKIEYTNRVKYILAKEGESFESLTDLLDLLSWQLPRYNDIPNSTLLHEGEKVYLQPKRIKAEIGKKEHIVKDGETLESISQMYAIRADKLAERNHLNLVDSIQTGEKLLLRQRRKANTSKVETETIPVKKEVPKEPFKESEENEEFQIKYDLD